ncbi:MAG: YheT family hydrolase [Rhodothermales bacterium]
MPLLADDYTPPNRFFENGHVQTVYPKFRQWAGEVRYRRERIETDDGDFLDLDWSRGEARRLAILSHGLEGSTQSSYIQGMTRALRRRGWDVLAWNYRGCSGEHNRLGRSYHSGATEDLEAVVQHTLRRSGYPTLALIGFSLGGNLVLKYLGERGTDVDRRIQRAVAFSVPCDLAAGSDRIARRSNWIYQRRFLRSLGPKIQAKQSLFPDVCGTLDLAGIRTLRDFDDRFTAPVHGFRNAADYYARSSSKSFLPHIAIPTLLVNAADDPFLPPSCYPIEEAQASERLYLQTPRHGGHVGFVAFNARGEFWSETRAADFLESTPGEPVGRAVVLKEESAALDEQERATPGRPAAP